MARSAGQVNSYCTIFDGHLECRAMQQAAGKRLLPMMRDDPDP